MNKQDLLAAYLKINGYPEIKSNSRKYRKFRIKENYFYFVGKRGGLRIGRNIKNSVSLTDRLKWNEMKEKINKREEIK